MRSRAEAGGMLCGGCMGGEPATRSFGAGTARWRRAPPVAHIVGFVVVVVVPRRPGWRWRWCWASRRGTKGQVDSSSWWCSPTHSSSIIRSGLAVVRPHLHHTPLPLLRQTHRSSCTGAAQQSARAAPRSEGCYAIRELVPKTSAHFFGRYGMMEAHFTVSLTSRLLPSC